MQALTAQSRDAERTDFSPNGIFLLTTRDPNQIASTTESTPSDVVNSVDGRTGVVTLSDLYANKASETDQRVPTDGSVTLAKMAFDPATQAELDSEASARAAADSAESSDRSAADTALQANIDTEATARADGDALAIPLTQKGAAGGVASLDSGSRVDQSPKLHANDHKSGGADAIELNELAAPTASVSYTHSEPTRRS
jgi:hypothetical protein